MPKFYVCKKHKHYSDSVCPECFPIDAANHAARKSKITHKGIIVFFLIAALVALYVILFLKCVIGA